MHYFTDTGSKISGAHIQNNSAKSVRKSFWLLWSIQLEELSVEMKATLLNIRINYKRSFFKTQHTSKAFQVKANNNTHFLLSFHFKPIKTSLEQLTKCYIVQTPNESLQHCVYALNIDRIIHNKYSILDTLQFYLRSSIEQP